MLEKGLSNRASGLPSNPHLSVLLNLCDALEVDLAHVVIDVWGPVPGIVVEYEPEDEQHVAPDASTSEGRARVTP